MDGWGSQLLPIFLNYRTGLGGWGVGLRGGGGTWQLRPCCWELMTALGVAPLESGTLLHRGLLQTPWVGDTLGTVQDRSARVRSTLNFLQDSRNHTIGAAYNILRSSEGGTWTARLDPFCVPQCFAVEKEGRIAKLHTTSGPPATL